MLKNSFRSEANAGSHVYMENTYESTARYIYMKIVVFMSSILTKKNSIQPIIFVLDSKCKILKET
jgi:hypothetical protein